MRIPLSAPDVTEEEVEAMTAVLRSSQLSLGPKLGEFEAMFAEYIGLPHAVAVSSGTAGLHLCVRALGIGPGDEVIVPSFTFIAAANAVRYEGATPVFADVEAESLNLCPEAVERAVTARTRAIVVVHTFGRPAEMRALEAIAERHGLVLIEDACEALGAETAGRRVGGIGRVGVFGFYPNKQITTGEGGMVVTRDAVLATRVRALRNQGRAAGDDWFQHTELGYNYRLPEVACAMGIGQMRRIEEILMRRAAVAEMYERHLGGAEGLLLPRLQVVGGRVSWFVYVVRLAAEFSAEDRDAVVAAMARAGMGCGRYFAPIHLQPAYAAWREAGAWLPVTEQVASRTVALPFFNRLREDEVAEVAATLKAVLSDLRRSHRSRLYSDAPCGR